MKHYFGGILRKIYKLSEKFSSKRPYPYLSKCTDPLNGYAQKFKTTSYSDGGSFLPPNFEKSYFSSRTSYDKHSRLILKLKQICAHKII
jgi:hypothetical protein